MCRKALLVSALLLIPFSVLLGLSNQQAAQAATSSTLTFQGRLLTSSGTTVADGTYNMQFNLYTASSGGTTQWTDTRLNNASQGITVKNGYFSVNLADTTVGGTAFPSTINWDQEQWLGMTVRGTGSCTFGSCTPADSEMTPRFKLTAVPYALSAGQLQKTSGSFTSTVNLTTPTANRTILFPDAGGTAILQTSTFTTNGVIYANANSTAVSTAAGTTGQCLIATTGSAPSWGTCAGTGSGVTLQAAYDNSATPANVNLATGKNVVFTLQDVATDPNFYVNIATGSTGKFAVQNNGTDVLSVTSSVVTAAATTVNLNTATVATNQATLSVFNATATNISFGGAATTLSVGANTGTLTLNNPTIVGSTASLTLFNTVATTVSAFGAATTINVGSTSSGTLTVRNPNQTFGNAAGSGLFKNNGATLNTTLALGDLAAGSIGTAATTVDIYTSFSISPTASGRTYTLPAPTGGLIGRVIYISNISANTFTIGSTLFNSHSTATLVYDGTSWNFAGLDGGANNYIQNQTASPQTAGFNINGNGTIGGTLAVTGTTTLTNSLLANNTATGTTGTTSGTGGTNTSSITLAAAGAFANGDIILVDNTGGSGQDYYTRITSGGGTTTLIIDVPVSYGTAAGYTGNATITKYTAQNVGAANTGTTFANSSRFFQGYFLGGVVTGAGSTTLSDQNLTSTQALYVNTGGNNTRLYVSSTGNVGIGNTNNTYKLDVTGEVNASTGFRVGGTAGVATTTCSGGTPEYTPTAVSGGIITAGSCTAAASLTGSGAASRIAYWSGASALTSNANFLYDGTNMSIGTALSTGRVLQLSGVVSIKGTSARLQLEPGGGATTNLWNIDNSAGTLRIFREDYASTGTGANGAVRLSVTDAGAVTIANTLDVDTTGSNFEGRISIEGNSAGSCGAASSGSPGIWYADAVNCSTFTGLNSTTDAAETWGVYMGSWGWYTGVGGSTYQGGTTTINNTSPTIVLQDSDNRNGAIHQNSNIMYFLSGSGTNGTGWTINGSYWPLTLNMNDDQATFGGAVSIPEGTLYVSSSYLNNTDLRVGAGTGSATLTLWGSTVKDVGSGLYLTSGSNVTTLLGSTAMGNVGACCSNYTVDINASDNPTLEFHDANTAWGNIVFNGGGFTFSSVITASGNNIVAGNYLVQTNFPVGGSTTLCQGGFGTISICTSSARYKTNIQDAPWTMDTIRAMRPVTYTRIENGQDEFGFIAEEMVQIDNRFGVYVKGQLEGVNYMYLTSVLASGIKQLDVQVQSIDSRLSVIESGEFSGNLHVQGYTELEGDLTVAGHTTLEGLTVTGAATIGTLTVGRIVSAGTAPSAVLGASTGTNAVVTIDGNDVAGTVAYTSGTPALPQHPLAAGEQVSVTFDTAYSQAPRVALTPKNAAAGAIRYYIQTSTTGFVIHFIDSPTASTTYLYDYIIVQ